MAENIIRGEFEYNGKDYPFVIQNKILTVVQSAFHYSEDFNGKEELGTLLGVTDTNKYILLLDCRIWNPQFIGISAQLQIMLHGYVLQDIKDDGYDRMTFCSPALNVFYSPRKAWTPQIGIEEELPGLTMNPYSDSTQQTTINILDENIQCILGFEWSFNLRLEDCHALSVKTNFSMEFQERKTSADIGKYYLYLRDFLVFANFRSDIPFDEITLSRRGEDGKFRKSGKVVIFQADDITYDLKAQNTITYDDLSATSFTALFKEIAEQRTLNQYNPYFIPSNRTESNVVDRAKWLVTASSFEGEFDKKYKDIKAEQSTEFQKAKSVLLSTIDRAVDDSGVSLNNAKNKYLKSFRHLIEHFDTTIKEKYKFCEKHFSAEVVDIQKKHCRLTGVPLDTDFSGKYAEARNRSAHGVIEPISNIDVVTFVLLRCFIYLLIMERADVPPVKMKEIIAKLF